MQRYLSVWLISLLVKETFVFCVGMVIHMSKQAAFIACQTEKKHALILKTNQ